MGRILYSCSGEGRGHASRARTIIEDLKDKHEITVYAPEHAYELLAPIYKKSQVTIRRIPGLIFYYNENKKLDYLKTIAKSVNYLAKQPEIVDGICRDIERCNPQLVITDFEPSLPKAAEKCGIPYISVDHQHFLSTYNLSALPSQLQQRAAFLAPSVNLFYMRQRETVVSSFYFPPLKKQCKNVTQVGVFLSRPIRSMTPHDGKHVLVYMRRHIDKTLLSSLARCGEKVILYTNEPCGWYKNIQCKKITPNGFIEDLATCRVLVSTAGNQLVGEALYFGKPVLSIPEPANYEQQINGHFLQESGGGENIEMEMINETTVSAFIRRSPAYAGIVNREQVAGNQKAYAVFGKYLSGGMSAKETTRIQAVS